MYLLKKVIQLREKVSPDHEKPFLEHLEELRIMIMRLLVVLVVSVLVCFVFQKHLLKVLRRPVEKIWVMELAEKLPTPAEKEAHPLSPEIWEKAKSLEHAAAGLDAVQRENFYRANADGDLEFHAKSVGLLRAALALPEEKRAGFLASLGLPGDLKTRVETLLKTGPNPEIDSRGNLTLMSSLEPTETFMLSMKLAFFAGIILAFPILLGIILQFVLPGLRENEKRVLWPSLAIGFGLFLFGVLMAYFLVLPGALKFFHQWGEDLGVSNDWRIGKYISFATSFTLLFGVAFELPVIVMVFVKLGLLTYETMAKTRSYAIVAIVVLAGVITPTPDWYTQSFMAVPMILLYEICIWLAWFERKKNRIKQEQEAREEEERRLALEYKAEDDSFEKDQ